MTKPLMSNNAKKMSKFSLVGIWIVSALLALPVVFLHKFQYVVDRVEGEKPFCSSHESSKTSFYYNVKTLKVEKITETEEIKIFQNFGIEEFMWILFFIQYFVPLVILGKVSKQNNLESKQFL